VKLASILFAVTFFAGVFALIVLPSALLCIGPLGCCGCGPVAECISGHEPEDYTSPEALQKQCDPQCLQLFCGGPLVHAEDSHESNEFDRDPPLSPLTNGVVAASPIPKPPSGSESEQDKSSQGRDPSEGTSPRSGPSRNDAIFSGERLDELPMLKSEVFIAGGWSGGPRLAPTPFCGPPRAAMPPLPRFRAQTAQPGFGQQQSSGSRSMDCNMADDNARAQPLCSAPPPRSDARASTYHNIARPRFGTERTMI
jgi:hypothetical protein